MTPPVHLAASALSQRALKRFQRRAFSLVELLTVVGIVALLGSATLPLVDRLGSASGASGGAAVLSQALSEARAYAVSKRTYTYVVLGGFKAESRSGPQEAGNARLAVGILATDDGMPLSGPAVDPARARFVSRITTVNNASLGSISSREGGLADREGSAAVEDFQSLTASGPEIAYPLSGTARYTFPRRVIEFAPDGTARPAGAAGIPRALEIGLFPSRGERVLDQAADVSVVQLNGLTGGASVYRP